MNESKLQLANISVNILDPDKQEMHTFSIDLGGLFANYQAVSKQRDELLAKVDAMHKAGGWMFDNLKPMDGTTNGVMPSRQAWLDATADIEVVQDDKPITK
jgi:hypothetical protein